MDKPLLLRTQFSYASNRSLNLHKLSYLKLLNSLLSEVLVSSIGKFIDSREEKSSFGSILALTHPWKLAVETLWPKTFPRNP